MVAEGVVLLRVQYFEHRCSGIPREAPLHELVHFIQNHDRVGLSGFLHGLQDTSCHGSHVRPPVAPDLGFIPDTAQGHPHIGTVQRFRDGFPQGGLAGSRRTHQQQGRAFVGFSQPHHRQVLHDAFLDLVHAIVPGVQDLPGFVQVGFLHRLLFPWQGQRKLQVRADVVRLRTCLRLVFQLPGFLQHGFLDLLRHVAGHDPCPEGIIPVTVGLAGGFLKFLFQGLDLPA